MSTINPGPLSGTSSVTQVLPEKKKKTSSRVLWFSGSYDAMIPSNSWNVGVEGSLTPSQFRV